MMRRTFALLIVLFLAPYAHGQSSNPYLGQIMWVSFNYCPAGWAEANGALLSIAGNAALFSLLGTTYGGNGVTTFALPDLRGRVAIHAGQGASLTQRNLGSTGGSETTTLSVNELPAHSHSLTASPDPAASRSPQASYLAEAGSYRNTRTASATLNPSSIGSTGSGSAFGNMPPFLTLRACICLAGVFPPQD